MLGIDETTNQSIDSDAANFKPEFEDSNMSFPDNSQQSSQFSNTMDSEFKYGK